MADKGRGGFSATALKGTGPAPTAWIAARRDACEALLHWRESTLPRPEPGGREAGSVDGEDRQSADSEAEASGRAGGPGLGPRPPGEAPTAEPAAWRGAFESPPAVTPLVEGVAAWERAEAAAAPLPMAATPALLTDTAAAPAMAPAAVTADPSSAPAPEAAAPAAAAADDAPPATCAIAEAAAWGGIAEDKLEADAGAETGSGAEAGWGACPLVKGTSGGAGPAGARAAVPREGGGGASIVLPAAGGAEEEGGFSATALIGTPTAWMAARRDACEALLPVNDGDLRWPSFAFFRLLHAMPNPNVAFCLER